MYIMLFKTTEMYCTRYMLEKITGSCLSVRWEILFSSQL